MLGTRARDRPIFLTRVGQPYEIIADNDLFWSEDDDHGDEAHRFERDNARCSNERGREKLKTETPRKNPEGKKKAKN